jgi:catechol 2,3-dioxygenase-like lactoylglutathione lyase family enzyme
MIYAIWFTLITILVLSILYSQGYFGFKGMQQSIPQLPYLDKEETIDFYRNVLGFEVSDDWDGYIITRKDKIEIHLWQCKDENLPKNTGCYIRYGRNIEDLYIKYSRAAIIHEHGKLELKPWGMKQFSILDNSGNIIHVGQNT